MDLQTKKMRKLLFTPLKTRKDLHAWIRLFFGLDLPDCIVDFDSTGTPLDAIWESYNEAQKKEPEFTRILNFSSRDSFKTLAQSIYECLSLLHLRRDIVHLAAIEQQSQKAQAYIKDFFNRTYLRDFVVGNNKREFEIVRFFHPKTGDYINFNEWKKLDTTEQVNYEEQRSKSIVIVATMKSANGQHGDVALDELDLIDNPAVYEEAKMIPAVKNGKLPMTYMTSSRKFSYGLVQKEIDEADKSGLRVRHWNIIDVTAGCPDSKHRPDLPKLTIYRSDDTLRSLSEEDFNLLSDKEKTQYIKDEGYHGCLNSCRLFAMCKGALATRQQSKSPLLKPIAHVTNLFAQVNLEVAKCQLLCLKPSSEGLIYSRMDHKVHIKTAADMAEMITGIPRNVNFSKTDLINLLKNLEGAFFCAGIDFGFTHSFAVTLGCVWGSKIFIIDAFQQAELELNQQIDLCDQKIAHYKPTVYADTAYPAYIKSFKRAGYQMRNWEKAKGSVVGGIEIVRQKLMSSLGVPEMFFLANDPGCELLFKKMREYHWRTDPQGNPTDTPDDRDNDMQDSCRYLVMNVFGNKKRVAMVSGNETTEIEADPQDNWMRKLIDEAIGDSPDDFGPDTGKKGKFGWSF